MIRKKDFFSAASSRFYFLSSRAPDTVRIRREVEHTLAIIQKVGRRENRLQTAVFFKHLLLSRTEVNDNTTLLMQGGHGLINYKDTKIKCRHLKKLTCKGT
jgi:hypothetical protein